MAKRSTGAKTAKRSGVEELGMARGRTVGLDIGDRHSYYCVLDGEGRVVEEGRIPTTRDGLRRQFGKCPAMRIALRWERTHRVRRPGAAEEKETGGDTFRPDSDTSSRPLRATAQRTLDPTGPSRPR
jgi:hypothetical protein